MVSGKTDFKVISVKQILLYHYGVQNAFPKKEFPCLLHHKYLAKGNGEKPWQMLGVAARQQQQHVLAGGGAPELPSAWPQAPPFSERDPHLDHRNSSRAWEASNTTW